jgi:hypothetical protein
MNQIVELVKALAWPMVFVGALVGFRKPLQQLIAQLGQRATKLSVFNLSVELSTIPEFAPAWSGPHLSDVRQLSSADEFSSGAMALFEQIRAEGSSDYAVIDLGKGQQWLTSRLFIFAIMLERMRGLRCLVFVEETGNVRRRFLGSASPNDVRWALARRYSYLETAFLKACSEKENLEIRSPQGALDPWVATEVVNAFLKQIQSDLLPPDADPEDWITIGQRALWERARWIDGGRFERLFRDILLESWVKESPDASPSERVRAILRRPGSVVAVVDGECRFKSLVDRMALLEEAASRFAEVSGRD